MNQCMAVFNSFVRFGLQVFALSIIQLFGFVLAAQLTGLSTHSATSKPHSVETETSAEQTTNVVSIQRESARESEDSISKSQAKQMRMFGQVALVCLLNASAMVLWIQRCTLTGFGLIAGTFFVFFSCLTIMPQSETFLFLRGSGSIIRSATIMGSCVSLLFAIATVPVFWRFRKTAATNSSFLTGLAPSGILWRLAICAVVYAVLYVLFGYYIAWQNPELRVLYGGNRDHVLGFWERVSSPPTSNRVIPLQLLRGVAWTILGVGMVRFSRGNRWFLAVSVGLVLSIVMNAQLLFPNSIMSEAVRMIHLVETAISNFLFGVICVVVWTGKAKSTSINANASNRVA